MKEYKVVCSRDEYHNSTGEKKHYDIVSPMCAWGIMNRIYDTRKKAEEVLKIAKKRCAEFDKAHDNDRKDTIRRRHYNFRILEREVGEWK